jgi:hypothetical protein
MVKERPHTLEQIMNSRYYTYLKKAETFVLTFRTDSLLCDGIDKIDPVKVHTAIETIDYLEEHGKNIVTIAPGAVINAMKMQSTAPERRIYMNLSGNIDEDELKKFAENRGMVPLTIGFTTWDNLAYEVAKKINANTIVTAYAGRPISYNAVIKAMHDNIYNSIVSLDQILNVAKGKDTGLKFLPDEWANSPNPLYLGNEAYVSHNFLTNFKGKMSPKGRQLTFGGVANKQPIECTYAIETIQSQFLHSIIYHLKLNHIKEI